MHAKLPQFSVQLGPEFGPGPGFGFGVGFGSGFFPGPSPGGEFDCLRIKTITNKETGERMTVETVKRVKEWFWIAENGKINLAVKYGAKTLPLNKKGANAIELTNGTELIGTLHKLKDAVVAGEFDDAISEVSDATRKAFNK